MSTETDTPDAAQSVIVADENGVARTHVIVLPEDATTAAYDLDSLRSNPILKRGAASFEDVDSFIKYIKLQNETPTLYANGYDGRLTAVFDDHVGDTPGHRKFTASVSPRQATAWTCWMNEDDYWLSASAMARMLKKYGDTIVTPDPVTLLEFVENYRATRTSTVEISGTDDGDSAKANSVETNVDSDDVADRVKFSMPVFDDADPVEIEASFRYEVRSEELQFKLDFDDPSGVRRKAVNDITDYVTAQTGYDVLFGSPATDRRLY